MSSTKGHHLLSAKRIEKSKRNFNRRKNTSSLLHSDVLSKAKLNIESNGRLIWATPNLQIRRDSNLHLILLGKRSLRPSNTLYYIIEVGTYFPFMYWSIQLWIYSRPQDVLISCGFFIPLSSWICWNYTI